MLTSWIDHWNLYDIYWSKSRIPETVTRNWYVITLKRRSYSLVLLSATVPQHTCIVLHHSTVFTLLLFFQSPTDIATSESCTSPTHRSLLNGADDNLPRRRTSRPLNFMWVDLVYQYSTSQSLRAPIVEQRTSPATTGLRRDAPTHSGSPRNYAR
jgi:hypothetical protein